MSRLETASIFMYFLEERRGEYTLEKFEVALKQFRMSGAPLIYTYFLELPEKEQESGSEQRDEI